MGVGGWRLGVGVLVFWTVIIARAIHRQIPTPNPQPLPESRHRRSPPAKIRRGIAKFRNLVVACKDRTHHLPLNTDSLAVNNPHTANPSPMCFLYIVFNHIANLTRRN